MIIMLFPVVVGRDVTNGLRIVTQLYARSLIFRFVFIFFFDFSSACKCVYVDGVCEMRIIFMSKSKNYDNRICRNRRPLNFK